MKTTICDICGKHPKCNSLLTLKEFSVVERGAFGKELNKHKFDICSECLQRITKEVRGDSNDD